jgi:hypothetical protein
LKLLLHRCSCKERICRLFLLAEKSFIYGNRNIVRYQPPLEKGAGSYSYDIYDIYNIYPFLKMPSSPATTRD